jgi:AraC-like DNA-binding protein
VSQAAAHRSATPRPDSPASIRFSTDQFREHEKISAWREFIGRMFCKVNIEPHSRDRFASSAEMRMLPGLGLVSGNCAALSYVQSPALIENDDVILTIAARPWQLTLAGRDTAFAAGEAVVTSAASLGTYSLPSGGPHWGVRVPLALLSPLVTDLEDAFGRRIPAGHPGMQLLTGYLGVIKEVAGLDQSDLGQRTVAHIHDLLALTIGATRDAEEIARGRGLQAARLRAIKQDIARLLHQPDLSVAAIAARHRCAPRSVQRLFEAEGTTFSEYVLTERLARARRMLADPHRADDKVYVIALDAGFSDPSYFHRSFRQHYGESPTAVREDMRAQDCRP